MFYTPATNVDRMEVRQRNSKRASQIVTSLAERSIFMKKQYTDIRELLQNKLLRNEEPTTKVLIEKLRYVKPRGFFTKPEFLEVCKWKDPRQLRRSDWEDNKISEIVNISKQVFATHGEYQRIVLLDRLKGVGVPIASAILTLTDPQAYGVIDIRVWQVLYLYGEVNYDPQGTDLSTKHWLDSVDHRC